VGRVRDGRLRTNIGIVSTMADAAATFSSTERRVGKTVVRVRTDHSRIQSAATMETKERLVPAV
jgi:hypothetical protein